MRGIVLALLLLIPSLASGAIYNIGAGQTYPTIASFNWRSLQPGDTVRIHPGTYKEMIWLSRSGTEANPIVIEGVPDASGNLPVLDGSGMVVPLSYDGHLSEFDLGGGKLAQGYGLVFIHWSTTEWGASPEWITVRNLEAKSAHIQFYTFTNSNGAVQSYPGGGGCMYVKTGNHLTFENNIMHDCGNGFVVQGVDAMVHDVTLRGNHIYGNGRTDASSDREHNIYTEASGITIENNILGRLRSGAAGSSLKDRSANTVIRYNTIYSGARALDLVEPENQSTHNCTTNAYTAPGMHEEPGFDKTWVYGNAFINGPSGSNLSSTHMFHYGADNCPATSRAGTLNFYNNTVYIDRDEAQGYYTRIFDVTSNRETVNLQNNAFMSAGNTHMYFAHSSDSATTGTFNFNGGNWITDGFTNFYTGDTGVWNETVPLIKGTNAGVFRDGANFDFHLLAGSALVGKGTGLPAYITAAHNLTEEYAEPRTFTLRANTNDTGAFSYSGAAVPTIYTILSGAISGTIH